MISMVIPTYNRDLACLERLLDSMLTYWQIDQLSDVLIVLNDKEWVYPKLQAVATDPIYSLLPIRTMQAKELMDNPEDEWGWSTQQHIKLKAADLFRTPWYIIHDSKDYYVDHVNIQDFVVDDRAQVAMRPGLFSPGEDPDVWLVDVNQNFYFEYRNAYRLFSLNIDAARCILRPVYSSSVFVANTSMVKSLLRELESRFGLLAEDLFLNKLLFTEYALISAWHEHKGKMTMYESQDKLLTSNLFRRINMSKDLRGKRPRAEKN